MHLDILEWVFKERKDSRNIKEINSLKKSIKPEIKLFHKFWEKYKEKRKLITSIKIEENKNEDTIKKEKKLLKIIEKLPKLNNEILSRFNKILKIDKFSEVLIKKIIFESIHGLHEVEQWVRRYGNETPPTSEQPFRKTTSGEPTPYYIEQAKRKIWNEVKNEEKLETFINTLSKEIREDFNKLKQEYNNIKKILDNQSRVSKSYIKNKKIIDLKELNLIQEDRILIDIRRVLMDIFNKIIQFANKTTLLEFDERKIIKPIKHPDSPKKVGVILIHGVLCGPQDLAGLEAFFRRNGFITYNVRLPGHKTTVEEFVTTSINELRAFLIKAFKYFYQYMAGINKGDGRFYIAGVSLGAMLPLDIMTIRFNSGYSYQNMIKGMISMGAYILPGKLGFLNKGGRIGGGVQSLVHRIIPKVLKIPLHLKKEYKFKKIEFDKLADDFKKNKLSKNDFKKEVKFILRQRFTEIKNKLSLSDQRLYGFWDGEKIIEYMANNILDRTLQGKKPIDDKATLGIETLLTRNYTKPIAYKSIYEIGILISHLRRGLGNIHIPILVMHGLLDTFASPQSANIIYKGVRSRKKYMLLLKHSGHIPTIDLDRRQVFDRSLKFITQTEKILNETKRTTTKKS